MKELIESIVTSYCFGIFALFFGIYILIYTLKNAPRETNLSLQPFMSGVFGSIGFIILGIVTIYLKIKGEI